MWTRQWNSLWTVANAFCALWKDQSGAVLTTEVVLVGTVLGTGTLVGLAGLRDTVVQELGDLSATIAELNQAYSFSSVQGCSAATAGSQAGDLNPERRDGLAPLPDDAASQNAQPNRFIVIDATSESDSGQAGPSDGKPNNNTIPTPEDSLPLGDLAT